MYVEALGAGRVQRGGKRSRGRREGMGLDGTRSPRHTRRFRGTESDSRRRPAPRPPGPPPRPARRLAPHLGPTARAARRPRRPALLCASSTGSPWVEGLRPPPAAAARRARAPAGRRSPRPHSRRAIRPLSAGPLQPARLGPRSPRPGARRARRTPARWTCPAGRRERPSGEGGGAPRRGGRLSSPGRRRSAPPTGAPLSAPAAPPPATAAGAGEEERKRPLAASRRLGGRRPPRRRGELTRAAPRPGLRGDAPSGRQAQRGSAPRAATGKAAGSASLYSGPGPASQTALKAALDGMRVAALLESCRSGWAAPPDWARGAWPGRQRRSSGRGVTSRV